jgi:DNA-binding response OmpR family regulator
MGVSMTWPQYRRRQCMIGGQGVRLTPQEAEILLNMLLTPPDRFVAAETLFGMLWPNPDDEPEDLSPNYVAVFMRRLRLLGLRIETQWGWGWRVPADARA